MAEPDTGYVYWTPLHTLLFKNHTLILTLFRLEMHKNVIYRYRVVFSVLARSVGFQSAEEVVVHGGSRHVVSVEQVSDETRDV